MIHFHGHDLVPYTWKNFQCLKLILRLFGTKQDQKSTRCDISKPVIAKPNIAKPETSKPDTAKPDVA